MFQLFKKHDSENDFSINFLTLAFKDKGLESQFNRSYFENNLQIGRACHIIAIFFYCVVGLWDGIVVDPSRLNIWIWVISLITIMFLAGLASSYFSLRHYALYWQQLFAFYVFATGAGFTFVSISARQHYPIYNFVGIIFCLFFCYAFIRLTFLWACAAGNTIVMLYTVCIAAFVDIPLKEQSISFFYMFGINLLGMMVCYSLELMSRRDFILNILLKNAENKATDLNINLEQKVKERTNELKTAFHREKELVLKLEIEEKRLIKTVASLEQAEDIAKLGYFEKNWLTEEDYWSKGFFRLLGDEHDSGDFSFDQFLKSIHKDDRQLVKKHFHGNSPEPQEKDFEFRLNQKDGKTIQIQGIINTFYDKNSPLITKAIFQDITDRKEAEKSLKQMENQLIQAQKMESVGRLAGGVAHDYNNISSIIIGFTELSLEDLEPHDPLYSNLEEILSAAKRATDITAQLLAFARKQTVAPLVIDLNTTVNNMLKILRRLIGEDIQLIWSPGKNIWPIKIDPTQLDQILANLCVNARDAITNTGEIIIETANMIFDESYCKQNPGSIPGEYALLTVSDDGQGMSTEILNNIFEPFFTTKETGRGTGLGLATVYGIVKQNNGYITAYSKPGKGSRINVYFPKSSDKTIHKEIEDAVDLSSTRGSRILLVEDDISILNLGKKMLNKMGYTVLAANNPNDAVELATRHKEQIHLLITDVIMPEMNGRQLADRLQTIYPDIKILFMSGYTADVIAHHGILDEGLNFLNKPFSKKSLANKLQEIFVQH